MKKEVKETSKWVLGGNGITNIKNPNADKAKKINSAVKNEKKTVKK